MSHDQHFKNLILDDPHQAIAFSAASEPARLDEDAQQGADRSGLAFHLFDGVCHGGFSEKALLHQAAQMPAERAARAEAAGKDSPSRAARVARERVWHHQAQVAGGRAQSIQAVSVGGLTTARRQLCDELARIGAGNGQAAEVLGGPQRVGAPGFVLPRRALVFCSP